MRVHLGLKNPPSIQLKVTCLRQLPHCTSIYFSFLKHHFVVICMEEKIFLRFHWLDRTHWSQWTYLCPCCQSFNLPIWFSTIPFYFSNVEKAFDLFRNKKIKIIVWILSMYMMKYMFSSCECLFAFDDICPSHVPSSRRTLDVNIWHYKCQIRYSLGGIMWGSINFSHIIII
jgi:hypothetical protein